MPATSSSSAAALPVELDAERLRDGVGQQRGVGQAGELDHPRAVRPAVGQCVRRGLRQAALADAAGADDGHEPVRVAAARAAREVGVAAVQRRQLRRQVGQRVRQRVGSVGRRRAGIAPRSRRRRSPSSAAVNR